MKVIFMFLAFVLAHVVCGWLAWAGGMNFDERGNSLQLFAFISITLGAYAAFGVFMFYESKR